MIRATWVILAAVLLVRETAGAQSLRASTLGITSSSCASCDVPPTRSWPLAPSQADDSAGERHLVRVVGFTVTGAVLGAVVGALVKGGSPNCSADICGLRESQMNQGALLGGLLGTVAGFSIGMVVWGARSD